MVCQQHTHKIVIFAEPLMFYVFIFWEQDRHLWTLNHISVVQSLVRLQYDEHEQVRYYILHLLFQESLCELCQEDYIQ